MALLLYTNRILNPALAPILIGLVIGIGIGSYILFLVQPAWIKFLTFFLLLPLILLQAAGIRRPIRAEKAIGIPFEMGWHAPLAPSIQ